MFTILGGDGKEYGPVETAKIQEWIAGRRANLQTRARRDGETEWKTLGDFPEFNPTPGAVPPAVPPAAVAVPPPAPGQSPFVAPVAEAALPSRWLRLGAVLLDGIIGGALMIPGFILLTLAGALNGPGHDPSNPALALGGFLAIAGGGLLILVVQIVLLTTRGQTIGKLICKLRIVSYPDGGKAGFVKAVLLRIIVNGIIGAIPFLGMAYSLVDVCFIFRADKRCIHDLIASTQVVHA